MFAMILMLASLFIFAVRPPPPPPPNKETVVSVDVMARDLERDGRARVRFTLDRPALADLTIGYELVSEPFAFDRHFAVEPKPLGAIVVHQGESAAELVLKKLASEPPAGPASRYRKEGRLSLSLSKGDSFEYAGGTRQSLGFPCAMTEFGPPYRLSLGPARGFREQDARQGEQVTVTFRLDRAPTDHGIPIRFHFGGDASEADFEVVGRPPDDTLVFRPGEREASLVLRRRPGPRGLGDRTIRIGCDPSPSGEVSLADARDYVSIPVPDPQPRLSWDADPPGAGTGEPRGPASARGVTVKVTPPSSRRIVFRYRVVGPGRNSMPPQAPERTIVFEPPDDPWAKPYDDKHDVVEVPSDDLVSPREGADESTRTFRLIPVGDVPIEPPQCPFVAHAADAGPLSGQVLVILLLTEDLAADEPIWRELRAILDQAEEKGLRRRLVDRSIFVLDGNDDLRRLRFEAIKDLMPFPRGAMLDQLLRQTRARVQDIVNRLKEEDKGRLKYVLLVRDITDQEPESVIKAFDKGLYGTDWWVYWIDPDAERSPLARAREIGRIRQDAPLAVFDIPKQKLAEKLLALLADGG
jgi:hypothetical protein